ncbi:hypothetical protein [Clostridium uliginosum]|uniref:Uncharacterized protein n=1 Tax=Clostridium uliginosum TaxID=119641 RepID=A0A1I1PW45_9CLOT|nr:hypothetical protein [Clostridium uliginosum]SFD11213.1 hypothetical protein SAMN05421842_12029 [Clostridium uliginosum]
MGCRCNDISDCKNDIEVLGTGKGYIKELIELDQEGEEKLNLLANLCEATFTADNIDGLKSEEKKLNDILAETLSDLKIRVERKIDDLRDELTHLKREDKHYHERHHHNHD